MNETDKTNMQPEAKKGKSLLQFIKFALVGASNTLVDMIVNTGLSFVLNLIFSGSWIVYAAKAVGYGCGLLNSYFFNSRWTFREEHTRTGREKASFVAVNILVLLISFCLIFLFKKVFGLNAVWESWDMPAIIKKVVSGDLFCSLLSTCVCVPVNFILNKLFVFKGKKEKAEV